jgi:hypothetical protein
MSFLDLLSAIFHNHLTQGAISGLLAAAAVDFQAFRSWKSFQDAASYSWGTALFRWFQGAVVGFVAAAGIGWVVGS